MAGFAKIWICIHQDEWFLSLHLNERGMWYELIVLAKEKSDSGTMIFNNWQDFSRQVSADSKTCRKILTKFDYDGKIFLTNLPNGMIKIAVVKYKYWQELTLKRGDSIRREKSDRPSEKSSGVGVAEHSIAYKSIDDEKNKKPIDLRDPDFPWSLEALEASKINEKAVARLNSQEERNELHGVG